jgi:hypothetical protein
MSTNAIAPLLVFGFQLVTLKIAILRAGIIAASCKSLAIDIQEIHEKTG